MQNNLQAQTEYPGLTQLRHNSNAWIGHLDTEPAERLAGQTFLCPADGRLHHIEVYSSSVHHQGNLYISFHQFDQQRQSWGPALASSQTSVGPDDAESWIRFPMPDIWLKKDATYGFRVQSNDALVAIGETALTQDKESVGEQEWNSRMNQPEGEFFRYFSLAYKVEINVA